MPLNRLLQIVIAALAAMGTMLLCMGQQEIGMSLLTILAAGVSVWLTDIKGWMYLNRKVANLIMLGVALFSLRDLFHIYSEMQALSFAQLLTYLQIILLFQKKDNRTNWLLIMLSLLQVVVAALFSQGVFFGILLVIYMILASLALMLLLLNRQNEPQRTPWRKMFGWGGVTEADEGRPDLSGNFSGDISAAGKGSRPRERWPLLDRQSGFERASTTGPQGVVKELFRRLFGISARTMGLTVALFILVPRFGQVGWRGGISQPQATVGFNEQVTLGEMGQIIESPNEVMRVRFFQGKSEIPYPTSGEIYLFGALLMEYENGQWKTGWPASYGEGTATLQVLPHQPMPKNYVVQKCDLEGLDHCDLFFVDPYLVVEDNRDIIQQEKMCRLIRDDSTRKRRFSYRLGTTAFKNSIQSPLTPRRKEEYVWSAKKVPQKNGEPALKKLKAIADQWIAESKLPPEDTLGRAQYLNQKLAHSGLFKYSLEGQNRDPSMDPIEDFLTVHRAGHCEYFATALTLLLRHAGIPARMVVGFKCDEYHPVEQCYQVRQLHAHTWVQAYVEPKLLPKEMLHGEECFDWNKNGGWLRLDPTPGGEERVQASIFSPIAKGLQWLDFEWSYYVVELNYERQRRAIFAPIAAVATKAFEAVRDPKTWRNFYERIGEALHRSGVAGAVAWLLLILAVAAGFAFFGLIGFIVWRLGRKMWRLFSQRHAKRRLGPRIEVEFYRRWEHVLAKNGLSRPLGQTPREFALVAEEWLARRTDENRLFHLPLQVVEAYYRVRFGQMPLDSSQSQELERILKEVEMRIANSRLAAASAHI